MKKVMSLKALIRLVKRKLSVITMKRLIKKLRNVIKKRKSVKNKKSKQNINNSNSNINLRSDQPNQSVTKLTFADYKKNLLNYLTKPTSQTKEKLHNIEKLIKLSGEPNGNRYLITKTDVVEENNNNKNSFEKNDHLNINKINPSIKYFNDNSFNGYSVDSKSNYNHYLNTYNSYTTHSNIGLRYKLAKETELKIKTLYKGKERSSNSILNKYDLNSNLMSAYKVRSFDYNTLSPHFKMDLDMNLENFPSLSNGMEDFEDIVKINMNIKDD